MFVDNGVTVNLADLDDAEDCTLSAFPGREDIFDGLELHLKNAEVVECGGIDNAGGCAYIGFFNKIEWPYRLVGPMWRGAETYPHELMHFVLRDEEGNSDHTHPAYSNPIGPERTCRAFIFDNIWYREHPNCDRLSGVCT